jgi:hypothetical protein
MLNGNSTIFYKENLDINFQHLLCIVQKNLIFPRFITINWSFISGGVPTAAERILNLAEKRPQTPVKTKLVGRDPATGYKG